MQKKVIALAVAGVFSGVAFAQSNVTVYGVVDQAYMYRSIDNTATTNGTNKYSGIADGGAAGLQGSRFGFRGEEGLGNGLKAVFTMEYGRDADSETQTSGTYNLGSNASIGFITRQAFVGLSSATMGQLTLGRQYNAVSDYYGNNSSNGVTGVYPVNQLQGGAGSQIRSQGGTARQDNVVKYVSPNWSGFSMRADYAFGEAGGQSSGTNGTWFPGVQGATLANADTTDSGRYAIALDYSNGPLNVDVAYAGQRNLRTTYTTTTATYDAEGGNIDEWYVGGAYDLKFVKLYGTYQEMKNGNNTLLGTVVTAATANDATHNYAAAVSSKAVVTKSKLWSLGASVPVSAAGTVRFEYAQLSGDQDNEPASSARNGGAKGYGLGYTHELSKRTTLYTAVSQIKWEKSNAFTSDTSAFNVSGEKSTNFAMGVNHKF